MKNIIFLFALFLLFSCKNQNNTFDVVPEQIVATAASGKQLFETNNCAACHQIAEKVVGPSLQNIAQIYTNKKGSISLFLKAEAEPIVDPSQYESMKLNLEITKTMSDTELKSIELYILSTL